MGSCTMPHRSRAIEFAVRPVPGYRPRPAARACGLASAAPRRSPGMTDRVIISDVAPRDGIQSIASPIVTAEAKIALIRALHEAGIRRMEVGSFVSPKAIPQMAGTEAVLAAAKTLPGLECTVLVPNQKGFEAAIANGADRLGLFMS